MPAPNRLRQVGPDVDVHGGEVPADAPNTAIDSAALGVLLLSLKTLSQRTLVAIGNLLTIASVASVWWLFNEALPTNPSVNQLVGLGLYGLFVLVVHRVAGRL